MNWLKRFCRYAFAVILAGQIHAQMPAHSPYWIAWNRAQSQDAANARGYANISFAPSLMSIRGKPFTATRVWTEVLRVPGQNSEGITQTLSAVLTIARDSKGRIHTEMAVQGGTSNSPIIVDVYIYDPVAHTLYRYFTTPDHVLPAKTEAQLTHMQLISELSYAIPSSENEEQGSPPEGEPRNATNSPKDKEQEPQARTSQRIFAPESERPMPESEKPMPDRLPDFVGKEAKQDNEAGRQVKDSTGQASNPPNKGSLPLTEDLGEKEINGIRAIGFRQVLPYGKSQQDFLIQDEWFSPEYAMNVGYSLLRSNPQMKTSYDLITVADGEPDPSLFLLPAGYVVVEQPRIHTKK